MMVPVGEAAAALVYRAPAHRDDDPPFDALMSSIYGLPAQPTQ